jgi:hypothetical protein
MKQKLRKPELQTLIPRIALYQLSRPVEMFRGIHDLLLMKREEVKVAHYLESIRNALLNSL